jgi:hypothetical protein
MMSILSFFSLKVETFGATRELCIQKSEMRSFNINQQSYPGDIWALVCETESKLGCKIVTMRSVIQVCLVLGLFVITGLYIPC